MTGPAPRHLPCIAACLALLLAGCGDPPDAPSVGPATDVASAPPTGDPPSGEAPAAPRWDGFGAATFGMTADEVRAAWRGGELEGNPAEGAACFHLSPTSQPDPAYFAMMFGDGRLVRYSAANDAMTAPGGGRRGMSAADIEALHPGQVDRAPHMYTDGEYLRIRGDGGTVLVFATDGAGTVVEWRVGVPPYVDYVEGCA